MNSNFDVVPVFFLFLACSMQWCGFRLHRNSLQKVNFGYYLKYSIKFVKIKENPNNCQN